MDKSSVNTFLILSFLYVCTPSAEIKKCGQNEEWSICTNYCLADKCSDLYYTGEPQQFCPLFCMEGCACKQGYVLDDFSNSGCVLPEQCPRPSEKAFIRFPESLIYGIVTLLKQGCPGNREYNECGSACPLTCQFPEQRPCQKNCVPGCFCKPGLYEDGNGNCIPLDKCPIDQQLSCGTNEIADLCPYDLQPTCRVPFPNAITPSQCIKQCICSPPFVRSLKSGDCVDRETCDAECEHKYKTYNPCGSACPATCLNLGKEVPPCIDVCVEGCECKAGYILDQEGNCIPPEFCDCKTN